MPQLNVYLDGKLLRKIQAAAKMEGCSISKWVRNKLTHAMQKTWPEGYFDVFGSLSDVDLRRPKQDRSRATSMRPGA